MLEKNLFAGFGGQGVLLMGQLLAYAGMTEGKHVSWFPAYGAEMRGGTANCSVILSDKPVASPLITQATAVVAMNLPSLDKFEGLVQPGKMLFINSSIIERKAARDDVEVFYVPCNKLAEELGNTRVANMVMLGAYLAKSHCVEVESVLDALLHKLGEKKADLIPLNREALAKGAAAIG